MQMICDDPFGLDVNNLANVNSTALCDGADVHLGPGAFLSYPIGQKSAVAQQPMILGRCPGAAWPSLNSTIQAQLR